MALLQLGKPPVSNQTFLALLCLPSETRNWGQGTFFLPIQLHPLALNEAHLIL